MTIADELNPRKGDIRANSSEGSLEPRSHDGSDGGAAPKGVRPRDRHDLASRPRGRKSEWVALALDDERRHPDSVQLREAALLRPPRWVERECEAEHGGRAHFPRGAARDARARGAAADEQRRAQLELADHRQPRG